MKIFDVMLEGKEDDETGYFVTLEVSASSKSKAGELAIAEAVKQQLKNLKIEDIELKYRDASVNEAAVLKTYGKSYFPLKGTGSRA